MKLCAYCGRENEDDAVLCRECGTQFVVPSAETELHQPGPSEITSPSGTLRELALDLNLKPRWLLCSLGLVVLGVAVALFLSRNRPKASAPRIVVLATWCSNAEQVVTFRPDPQSAEITTAVLASASDDGKTGLPTVRDFGQVFPVLSR